MVANMKTAKTALVIFALYIIQTVFGAAIAVRGITADLFLAFLIPYAFLERRFDRASSVIIICAVLAATVGGRVFAIAVLVIGMAGIATHLSADYLRFIPGIIRAEIICVIASLVMCIAEQYAVDLTIPVRAVINASILETVYTVFVSCVFWLLLKKTMFRDKKSNRLQLTKGIEINAKRQIPIFSAENNGVCDACDDNRKAFFVADY